MRKLLIILFFGIMIVIHAQAPAGYYDSANGKTGYVLKTALKDIITNGHIARSYGDLYTLYQISDTDNYYENNGTVLDMYSEKPSTTDTYEYQQISDKCGTVSAEGNCYNREHIMPQSSFNSASPMKSDEHFIVPADGYVNNRRSNYPFGIVTNPTWTSTNGSKVGTNTTQGYTGTVFEPIDEFKGDIARMLFYVATRYEDSIANWSSDMLNGTSDQVFADWFLDLLLQWDQDDPVSQREIDRNNAVYNFQGNRNPFIDHPEWVNEIWQSTANNNNNNNNTGNNSTQNTSVLKIMDFDGTTPEWSFTNDVAFFDNNSNGFFGIHDANNNPNDGTPTDTGDGNSSDINVIDYSNISGDFLFVNDLDDEGNNGTSGEATITFDSVDISNATNVVLSFDYDINGFDSNDYIKYQVFLDGTGQGKNELPKNNKGTETISINDSNNSVYIVFYIKQNGGADQAALDNIKLEGETTAASSGPSITNVIQTPNHVTDSDTVSVSADVTDPNGIGGVELHWGTSSGNLSNTINMSNSGGDTYTTDSSIPAQPNGTTIYYEIYALDNIANDTTTVEYNYTVSCAAELIISEYIEGSSNNKFIELYNGTGNSVDLSNYQLRIYINGSSTVSNSITLSGTLADQDVYVIENSNEGLGVNADLSTNSSVMGFNGDDTLELYNTATSNSVDIIGQIGNDPGSQWGSGNVTTKDHTLVRKSNITAGDTDGTDAFDPTTEWVGYSTDDVSHLGSHTMNCAGCVEPTTDALFDNASPQNLASTTATLVWNNGDGENRIVLVSTAPITFVPTDGNTYPANASYGNGTAVDTDTYVVYNGSGTQVDITSLTPGTHYYTKIYEYNCSSGNEDYLTSGTPATDDFYTYPEKPSSFTYSCITNESIDLDWTAPATGNFDGYLLVVREANTPHSVNSLDPNTNLNENTDYTQAPTFGSTTPYSRILYKGTGTSVTITGLTHNTNYTFAIYTYITDGSSFYAYSNAKTLSTNIGLLNVSNAQTNAGNSEIEVAWNNPNAYCFDEILVVANETAGIDFTPSGDGSSYTANSNYAGVNSVVYKGTGTSVNVTGLTNGTTYYFEIFVRNGTEWSSGVEVSDTPADITFLNPGDLAILAVNTDIDNAPGSNGDGSGDQLVFVCFKDIKPGTKIYLTDNGYEREVAGKWGNTEGVIAITRTNTTLTKGTFIIIETNANTNGNIKAADQFDVWTCGQIDSDWNKEFVAGTAGFNLNNDDDVWIMQGGVWDNGTSNSHDATYNGKVLYGWTESGWDNGVGNGTNGTKWSNLYPQTKCFTTTAPAGGGKAKFDDPDVNGDFASTTNDQLDWISLINDTGNWVTYANNSDYNTGGFDYKGDSNCPQMTIVNQTHLSGKWKGTEDANWFNCSNWDDLKVPNNNTNVVLSSSASNQAVIDSDAVDSDIYNDVAEAYNLTIENGNWIELYDSADILKIYGDFIIESGANLDMDDGDNSTADGNLYLYGNWDNQATEADFYEGQGTVHLVGSVQQTVTASDGTAQFYNLEINNPQGVLFTGGNIHANGDLTITQSMPITITDGHYMLAAKHLINNADIVIENQGSLVQTDDSDTGISGSGTFKLNKISKTLNNYYDYVYWSSPINSTTFTLGDIVSNAWRYYDYDPSYQPGAIYPFWHQLSGSDVPNAGQGYAVSAPENNGTGNSININASFIKANDPFNNGNISYTLKLGTDNDPAGDDDYNLVGNPYPSAIDFDQLATDNTSINGSYSLWTNCAGLDSNGHHQNSGYTTYAVGGGTAVSACSNASNGTAGRYIASAQGFMVEAIGTGNLVFKNSQRVLGNNDNFLNRPANVYDRMWLNFTDNNNHFNQIAIGFYNEATDGYDRLFDAYLPDTDADGIYTLINNNKYAIQGLSPIQNEDKTIPLGIKLENAAQINLHIERLEGVLNQMDIYLHDLNDNTYYNLKNSDFTLNLDAGEYNQRFELVFTRNLANVENTNLQYDVKLIRNNTVFTLKSTNGIKIEKIRVYDATGKTLFDEKINAVSKQMDLRSVAKGNLLLFHIQLADGRIAIKKAIR